VLWNLFQEVPQDDTNTSGEASQPKKVGADPFNNEETDPTKSGAMRKYLIIIKPILSCHFSLQSSICFKTKEANSCYSLANWI
jgi:hypothetical protein